MRVAPERWVFLMEYLLLGFVPLADLPSLSDAAIPVRPGLTMACVGALAVIGLWRPQTRAQKWLLVTAQTFLVTIAAFVAFDRMFRWLYLVPVTRASVLFDLRGRVIATAGCLVLGSAAVYDREIFYRHTHAAGSFGTFVFMLSQILTLWLVYGLLVMLATLMFAERHHREELQRLNEELELSREQLEELQLEQERLRIARDLHDTLGNSLTALNIQLENVQKWWIKNPLAAQEFLAGARETGQLAIRDVRQAVVRLRADSDKDGSLQSKLLQLTASPGDADGLQTRFSYRLPREPAGDIREAIYRITQEALTNSRRHARAANVDISLDQEGDQIVLRVSDDGVGLSDSRKTEGFGLRGMRERAKACGGTLAVERGPESGTIVEARFPLLRAATGR